MTLFNKLAGKASALLNASGICSNNCIDGHCSGRKPAERTAQTIVERIGEPAFLEQLAEECSELAQAALKTARKYRGENPTPKTIDECYDALQEEIADVMLCVSEYLDCKGPDYLNCVMLMKLKKHERWERRLKEVGK